jgi:hypothetical protein
MTRFRLLLTATCTILLSFTGRAALAQYYPGVPGYSTPGYRGMGFPQLPPYLNLGRGNAALDPALNYGLGAVPETERRFDQALNNYRFRTLEQPGYRFQEQRPRDPELDELVPPVPVAGFSYGRRTSRDYFREDYPGSISSLGRRGVPFRR